MTNGRKCPSSFFQYDSVVGRQAFPQLTATNSLMLVHEHQCPPPPSILFRVNSPNNCDIAQTVLVGWDLLVAAKVFDLDFSGGVNLSALREDMELTLHLDFLYMKTKRMRIKCFPTTEDLGQLYNQHGY